MVTPSITLCLVLLMIIDRRNLDVNLLECDLYFTLVLCNINFIYDFIISVLMAFVLCKFKCITVPGCRIAWSFIFKQNVLKEYLFCVITCEIYVSQH